MVSIFLNINLEFIIFLIELDQLESIKFKLNCLYLCRFELGIKNILIIINLENNSKITIQLYFEVDAS